MRHMFSVTTLRNYQEIPEVDHVTIWEAEHYEVPIHIKKKIMILRCWEGRIKSGSVSFCVGPTCSSGDSEDNTSPTRKIFLQSLSQPLMPGLCQNQALARCSCSHYSSLLCRLRHQSNHVKCRKLSQQNTEKPKVRAFRNQFLPAALCDGTTPPQSSLPALASCSQTDLLITNAGVWSMAVPSTPKTLQVLGYGVPNHLLAAFTSEGGERQTPPHRGCPPRHPPRTPSAASAGPAAKPQGGLWEEEPRKAEKEGERGGGSA